jgi:signal peptidase II
MSSKKPAARAKAASQTRSAPAKGNTVRRNVIKWVLVAVVAGIAVGLTLWTTRLVESRYAIGEMHKILPFLSIQRSANSGVAFGLLGGKLPVILAANGVAILVVLGYVFMDKRPVLAGIAGGMIVGGSLGNIVQRLTGDGHVTDFLKFPYWPNFNVPDVFIVLGIVVVFLGLIVEAVRVLRSGNTKPVSR